MSETEDTSERDSLAKDAWIDALCDRYEAARKAGRAMTAREFLRIEGVEPEEGLLREMARLEAAYTSSGSKPAHDSTADTFSLGAPGSADSDQSDETMPGKVIAGRYVLKSIIGEGGMGSVWLAQQTEPVKREVAIKLIKAGMDSKAVLARFETERQALAVMDHPNIAKILDGGLQDGRPFFVMELVQGVAITEFCDAGKLTPRQRLELFVPVCMAIQHAHQKGIIHRDIKPSNVLVGLVDGKPVPKVIDFGVAKATGGDLSEIAKSTVFGAVLGTPQYMSPEQAGLNNFDIDTRSDIYSLGILLYELLTGSPPFSSAELRKAGLLEILRVVREEEPPRPSTKLGSSEALPSLSANRGTEPRSLTGILRNELDWIVMKALDKDRTRRYETANGFAADINRYLCGEAVAAHPPSGMYRLRKFAAKNRVPVVAASLVMLALLAGIIGTTLGLWEAKRQKETADIAKTKETRERERAEENGKIALREKRKALKTASSSTFDRGQELCASGDVIRGLHVLATALDPAIQSGDVALEEAVRFNIDAWLPWTWRFRGHAAFDHKSACLNPDGSILIAGSHNGVIQIWNAKTFQKLRPDYHLEGAILKLAWQPKGDIVAILCQDGNVRLWKYGSNFNSARVIRVSQKMDTGVQGGLSFKPDGTQLLVGTLSRSAILINVSTGEQIGTGFSHGSTHADAVAFSPDGKNVVVATPNWSARVYEAETAKPLTPVIRTLGSNFCVAISPDGTKFATGHHMDASLRVWEMKTGEPAGPRIYAGGPVLSVAFSPDGKTVVAGGWTASTQFWDWKSGKPAGPPIHTGAYTVAFTPDGNGLMVSNPTGTSLWEMPDRGLKWTGKPLPASVTGLAFRPDSKELALAMSAAFTPNSDPVAAKFIHRYRTSDGGEVVPRLPQRNDRWVDDLRYGQDGKKLFGSEGQSVTVWDLDRNEEVGRYFAKDKGKSKNAGYKRIAMSDDGRFIAGTGWDPGAPTTAWEVESGRVLVHEPWPGGDSGGVIGFLPGTGKLYTSLNGKVTFWNLNVPIPLKEHLLTTNMRHCSASHSRDGKAIAIVAGADLCEFDLVTGLETGFKLGGMKATTPSYTVDGKLLFASDAVGHAAWHPGSRKKIGPFVVTGYGAVYGVSPDGTSVVTVNDERQVQLWRVPKPMSGTPEEIGKLVLSRTGFSATEGDILMLTKTPVTAGGSSQGESTAHPDPIVTDFRELHNADLPELKKWFRDLPDNFRPTHLTVQEGSDGKRFDSISTNDNIFAGFEYHLALSHSKGEKLTLDEDDRSMYAKKWKRPVVAMYYDGGIYHRHQIWTNEGSYSNSFNMRKDLALEIDKLRKSRLRPIGVIQYDDRLAVTNGSDEGRDWELHLDLTSDQVKQKLDECRQRGWRPTVVHRNRTDKSKFAVVLIQANGKENWEFHSGLSIADYELKLAEGRARGLRPQYVQSWVENGVPVYSAVWIGDLALKSKTPEYETLPVPRQVR